MNRMSKEGELSKLMNKLNIAKGRWIRALRVSEKGLKTDLDNDVLGDPWNPIFHFISIVGREGSTLSYKLPINRLGSRFFFLRVRSTPFIKKEK